MGRLKVRLKDRAYDIKIGSNILGRIGDYVRPMGIGDSPFIITDSNVGRLYALLCADSFKRAGFKDAHIETISAGEEHKSLESCERLSSSLLEFDEGINKRIFIVTLGGGVIGDLGGFVASVYRRGINYLQVPTTLLAMVDSGIGGKTGINFKTVKNLLGTFYQPRAVYVDLNLLKTLDKREVISALAEVIKYGVIEDAGFFRYLERNYKSILAQDSAQIAHIVKKSYLIKAHIVERDEFDKRDIRIALNYGHTIGHALEGATNYAKFKHGEAVSIGMVCENDIAVKLGLLREGAAQRIEDLLLNIGLPNRIEGVVLDSIQSSMRHDKKFIYGKSRFVLPIRLGRVKVVEDVDEALSANALQNRGAV